MSSRNGAATPIQGVGGVVELTSPAGGPTITIKNTKYSIEPDGNVAASSNTTDGRLRAPGLTDYTGSFQGDTDATTTSTAIEAQVMPNQIWDFKLYRSKAANTFWSGTLIILKGPKIETGTDQLENWSIDFAKAYGPLTLPNGSTF